MSRGFVKEDDLEHAGTDVPERPVSAEPNYVTLKGYAFLEQLAADLTIKQHDLFLMKDNQAAVQELATVNRELRYIVARLKSALITQPNFETQQVVFGATVTVEDENEQYYTYQIVGEDEADIKANKISWISPLAKALIGLKVNDSAVWKRPAGDLTLNITKIYFDK